MIGLNQSEQPELEKLPTWLAPKEEKKQVQIEKQPTYITKPTAGIQDVYDDDDFLGDEDEVVMSDVPELRQT